VTCSFVVQLLLSEVCHHWRLLLNGFEDDIHWTESGNN
jgi:hypothetical protein